ncbi:unnamed protein product [Parascedosporium putredinis]|uniref:Cytochrome P450 n=1 Tax=Parascedosporium putredinis TaxID=1442378 RepID=A0A9P1GXW6_9PEZI|nr:unnamed protein product [Parascedosporium putredinis]CAI7989592.1 unnamed protein product [Parascedosporium putredinis]
MLTNLDLLLTHPYVLAIQEKLADLGAVNIVLATVAAGAAIVAVDYARMLRLRSKMPPGPFPLPIVGNTLSLPKNKPWLLFEELSKKYDAPVITFWIGRNPTVWINDAWSAQEIFEKKAQIYSSRPHMVVFGELGDGQFSLVTMKTRNAEERDRWRGHRKLMHMAVGVQTVRKYRQIQNNESKIIALDYIREPKEYVKHLERYATSVVSAIGFGRRVASYNDPIITEVIALMQLAADLNVPGKSFPMLMETFPISVLAKFPRWAPWMKGLGSRGRGDGDYFYYTLNEEAVQQHAARSPASQATMSTPFAQTLFDEKEKYNLSKREISSLTANLFGAGADTSSSTLVTFMLACCCFRDAMLKAQAEIDAVIGPSRSPHWDDSPNLPYVNAFVKEVFRWRSVAIIGGQPHAPTQDDTYKGWLIPAGTWVQGNVWAIHHNERDFPDPDVFMPERFIQGDEHKRPFPNDKGYMTFGWGRRVCSGQALAEQGTWVSVARLLWAFDIRKKVDPVTGREVDLDIFAFTNGLNMRPQPFECDIIPAARRLGKSQYRLSTYYQAMKAKGGTEPVVDEKSGELKMVKVQG